VGGLKLCAKIASILDVILDICIGLAIIIALLYSGYGLWDTWYIYDRATVSSDLLKYKPTATESEVSVEEKFADIQEINPDICAWLTVDDTGIDYPIVQGESNLYYVNRDVYKEFSLSGSVFLDYQNSREFSDFYSLLYAHHMEGNVMFGEVTEFLDADYYASHKGGTIYTPSGSYNIEWFACISTDAYDDEVFSPSTVTDESKRGELLEYLKDKADNYSDSVKVTTNDKIIALSTCLDLTTNGRALLFGRLSPNVA
jgi:sortase B